MRVVCVDFDGVLNTYSGWRDGYLYEPRPGVRAFLERLSRGYAVVVLTTRPELEVWRWLGEHALEGYVSRVANSKLPAVAYIDDRAIRFDGDYDATLAELDGFRAHWEQGEARA